MKGFNTIILYRQQGATLREARMAGMVVGIPISTEHRKQISIESSGDLTPASAIAKPEIAISGLNPAFNYVDGDVIYEGGVRVWIRKSSEAKASSREVRATIVSSNNYGKTGRLLTFNPVVSRDIDGATATYSTTTREITFSKVIPDIAAGDTVYGTDSTAEGAVARIGKIGTPRTVNSATVAPVTWKTAAANGAITLSGVYYDYTADPVTGTPRGYVMYIDTLVYRTSIFGVKTLTSPDELSEMFGDDSVVNPLSNLAMGAMLYTIANGQKDKFKICALDLRNTAGLSAMSPQDVMDNAPLWANTTSKIDAHKDAYYLTTMTNNESVQSAWEAYTIASSTPERRRQKRYWVAKNIINGGAINYDPVDDDHYIVDTFGNTKYNDSDYAVGAKYDEGYMKAAGKTYFDKDGDVESAQATPMATNNERITYIGCEFATMGNVNLDGYYVSAIIAGWRASNPLGYVADDMAVPLLTGIPSSGGYYTEEDLDALHKSGWYMLNQETDGSPVTCYIQSTTAYDNSDKMEESIVIALDSAMKDACETLAPYIKGGLDNRVSATNPESARTVEYLAKCNAALAIVRSKYDAQKVFAVMEVVSIKVNELTSGVTDIAMRFVNYKQVREFNITGYVE